MRTRFIAAALAVTFAASMALAKEPMTDEQKTLYAIGVKLSPALVAIGLTADEFEFVKAGLSDAVLKKSLNVDMATQEPKVQELAAGRLAKAAEKEKAASQAFLTNAATEKGAVQKPSGLIYSEIKPGTGAQAKATDSVKVHYHGTLTDGTVFDSSVDRGEPATFALGRVIPCWTEGVALMKVGGKSKLICPPSIAYGDRGLGAKIKPGAVLVFEVELLEVTGDDKAAPAVKEPSGN
jgi:FKBP-type peptidyl-prolyl cis-trans isomerase FkpA/FKBP-type peptidyl-prolyl cis-trans isomerase FklB